MNQVMAAWLVEAALITYRGAKQGRFKNNPVPGLALPSEYIATVIVFGGLSLIPSSGDGGRVAAAAGWGLVMATFLNLWAPGSGVSQAPVVLTPKKTAAQAA